MIEISTIPHINAALNATSVVLLLIGRGYAKAGNSEAHKKTMIAALSVSVLFLGFYLTYHFNAGLAKFGGEGVIRPIYFTILIIHVLAAIAITPLVPMAVFHAIKGNRETHKRVVKWAWPIWVFVGVSGVVVYFMAIQIWPCTGACLATGLDIPGR